MATLLIAEFDFVLEQTRGNVPVVKAPPVAQQKVTFTTSTASNEFNASTRMIRVKAVDSETHLEFSNPGDSDPTADGDSAIHLDAGDSEYFAVKAGGKVAAYNGTS